MNLWHEYWIPVRVFLGLGSDPQTLTFVQISLRGIIVFVFTLLMVRVSAGDRWRAAPFSTAFFS